MDLILKIDGSILLWIQEKLRLCGLTPFMILITYSGSFGVIWILGACGMIYMPQYRKAGLMVIAALLVSVLINNFLLKNVLARPRPWVLVEGLTTLIRKPLDYSFPSGHTASSFAAAVLMCKTLPFWVGVAAMVLAVAISFSRLYLGVHYPSDVLGGLISGIIIGIVLYNGGHVRAYF